MQISNILVMKNKLFFFDSRENLLNFCLDKLYLLIVLGGLNKFRNIQKIDPE